MEEGGARGWEASEPRAGWGRGEWSTRIFGGGRSLGLMDFAADMRDFFSG